MTPEEFSKELKLTIQGTLTVFKPIPRNRRAFYERVIRDFEKRGICQSPSGLTAQIVCMYLKTNKVPFTLKYKMDCEISFFEVTRG